MNINVPSQVRLALYVVFGIGNLVSVYLLKKNSIDVDQVALYNGISAFVFALAGINVDKTV